MNDIEIRVHLDETHTLILTEMGLQLIHQDAIVVVDPERALALIDLLHAAADVVFIREGIDT